MRIRSIRFGRNLSDGRPQINEKGYYHEGFENPDNETGIRKFTN